MKIKLITALTPTLKNSRNSIFPNFGLATLESFLREEGFDVELIEMGLENSHRRSLNEECIDPRIYQTSDKVAQYLYYNKKPADIIKATDILIGYLGELDNAIVGFSISSYFKFISSLVISKRIKELFDCIIVFGGPVITLNALNPLGKGSIRSDYLLKKFDFIDYLVWGNGEIPLSNLCKSIESNSDISKIPGLIHRKSGRIIVNDRCKQDIDNRRIPGYDKKTLEKYSNLLGDSDPIQLYYQINSGCVSRCSFCVYYHYNILAFKSVEKIVEELKIMKNKYNINHFYFSDNAVNLSYKHLESMCDAMISADLKIEWAGMARCDNIDEKLLKKMRNSGCQALSFGCESFSPYILRNMGKGYTVKSMENILRMTKNAGMKTNIELITGYPYETQDDIMRNIRFLSRNKSYIDIIRNSKFLLEFNTLLYNFPEKYGIANIRELEDIPFSWHFAYDEKYGLKWIEKNEQIKQDADILRENFDELGIKYTFFH